MSGNADHRVLKMFRPVFDGFGYPFCFILDGAYWPPVFNTGAKNKEEETVIEPLQTT